MISARAFVAILLSVGCVMLGDGCSSCQAPYDYSGPTLDANGKPVGGFGTRVGSVWAGTEPNPVRPSAPTIAPPGANPGAPPTGPATPDVPGQPAETSPQSTAESGVEAPAETAASVPVEPPSRVNAVKFVAPDNDADER